MTREEAENILGLFLLEDIDNNRQYHEDTHGITWIGNHFAVIEYATGDVFTFRVTLQNSHLSGVTWKEEFERQGWNEYIERSGN